MAEITMFFVHKTNGDKSVIDGQWENAEHVVDVDSTDDELLDFMDDGYTRRNYHLLGVIMDKDWKQLKSLVRKSGEHGWDFSTRIIHDPLFMDYGGKRCNGYYDAYPDEHRTEGKQPEVSVEVWRRTPINVNAAWEAVLASCKGA